MRNCVKCCSIRKVENHCSLGTSMGMIRLSQTQVLAVTDLLVTRQAFGGW